MNTALVIQLSCAGDKFHLHRNCKHSHPMMPLAGCNMITLTYCSAGPRHEADNRPLARDTTAASLPSHRQPRLQARDQSDGTRPAYPNKPISPAISTHLPKRTDSNKYEHQNLRPSKSNMRQCFLDCEALPSRGLLRLHWGKRRHPTCCYLFTRQQSYINVSLKQLRAVAAAGWRCTAKSSSRLGGRSAATRSALQRTRARPDTEDSDNQ